MSGQRTSPMPFAEHDVSNAAYPLLVDRSGGPAERRERVVSGVAAELRSVTGIREDAVRRIAEQAYDETEALGLTTASERASAIAKHAMSTARVGTLDS